MMAQSKGNMISGQVGLSVVFGTEFFFDVHRLEATKKRLNTETTTVRIHEDGMVIAWANQQNI